ncbi:hypothetical protein LXM94_01875 [Rhizobium sp. TRM95111]|uniref:hypothetical protein n=1 Tax=Rhizobium alarense TaxID=2846851 RepID=UPI001F23F026|nr:hypothetical protein [Rhizobium alarense]MCF3638719.1 hypothetical protein [Rhizobium alarense]
MREDSLQSLRTLAASTTNLSDEVANAADSLAMAMHRVHGGNWRVQVDHECRFALIAYGGDSVPHDQRRAVA